MLLGDALNARHALTAGGMTAALNDTVLARDLLRQVPDTYDYSKVLNLYRQLLVDRKARTFSINVFAFALYHIYSSPDCGYIICMVYTSKLLHTIIICTYAVTV